MWQPSRLDHQQPPVPGGQGVQGVGELHRIGRIEHLCVVPPQQVRGHRRDEVRRIDRLQQVIDRFVDPFTDLCVREQGRQLCGCVG